MTDEHLEATVSLRGVLFAPSTDVLVVKRASDGGWELPGGRLSPHEDAAEGVHREIREETGLDVDVGRPIHAVSWRNDDGRGRFAVYYWCEAAADSAAEEADTDPVSLSREHTDHAWLPPDDALDRLSDVQERAVSIATEVYEP